MNVTVSIWTQFLHIAFSAQHNKLLCVFENDSDASADFKEFVRVVNFPVADTFCRAEKAGNYKLLQKLN